MDKQFGKFIGIFKKLHINIPFAEALEQMSGYVKFMKDILSKKRKFGDYETVMQSEECSSIFQKKLPPKLKDLGSFTIPCAIGNAVFERALCDLGVSINLISWFIFKKLKLGEARLTTVTLQLANRSLTHPCGIIEDVFVKVDKFIIPFDDYLHNLMLVLKRCMETNLVLNWEKCHFMVRKGLVLGHRISGRVIEVDRAKIEIIEKLPPPTSVKGVRSFLGHAGFIVGSFEISLKFPNHCLIFLCKVCHLNSMSHAWALLSC